MWINCSSSHATSTYLYCVWFRGDSNDAASRGSGWPSSCRGSASADHGTSTSSSPSSASRESIDAACSSAASNKSAALLARFAVASFNGVASAETDSVSDDKLPQYDILWSFAQCRLLPVQPREKAAAHATPFSEACLTVSSRGKASGPWQTLESESHPASYNTFSLMTSCVVGLHLHIA